jgi:teichuronic acid biosynthesis glycosyltransferase TuaC
VIGVVTTSYPRDEADFAGSFVRARVQQLVGGGAEVEVVAAGSRTTAVGVPDWGLFAGAGAPEALEGGGRAAVAAIGFSAALIATIQARAHRWSAVESHWLAPCGLAATLARVPHRAFAHGGDVALLERVPGGRSLARYLGRSATFVFASADLRRRFERLCGFAVQAEVAAAPIDAALFAARRDRVELRRRLGCEGPVVLGVGRLVPVKGWDVLVRAAVRLPAPVTVVLAGAGPESGALAARAAGRVALRLLGAIDRAAVADWMAAADVYVQPSRVLPGGRSEGTPVAVREALVSGLPVVATRTGGLAELQHPALTLVPPDDPAALAAAVAALLHLRSALRTSPLATAQETPHTHRYRAVNSL